MDADAPESSVVGDAAAASEEIVAADACPVRVRVRVCVRAHVSGCLQALLATNEARHQAGHHESG